MDLADLKTKTSGNMMIQGVRQQSPSANPAEINMDNYELTAEELKAIGLGN